MELEFEDQLALVTGGGSGIGRAICERFQAAGASVYVNDHSRERAEATAAMLGLDEERVLVADVAESDDVRAMFSRLHRLDILVNNAGIADSPELWAEADVTATLSDERWRLMIAVHLDGAFFCTRAALALMAPRGAGAIVNLSSTAALLGLAGAPHYAAAKAGVLGLTRSVAREVGGMGIRVNAVAPGYVATPMTEGLDAARRAAITRSIPLGRFASAGEIAEAVLFLAGPRAAYITGQCLSPNGGLAL